MREVTEILDKFDILYNKKKSHQPIKSIKLLVICKLYFYFCSMYIRCLQEKKNHIGKKQIL